MGRLFFCLVLACAAYAAVGHQMWDHIRPQDQLVWAALLPAAYLFGMALLKD